MEVNGVFYENNHETGHYDEIEIEDMTFDENDGIYYYTCPCGDLFQLSIEDIMNGECIAKCPSCSLIVKVIYNIKDFNFETEVEMA